jgi:hypothetical protein
MIRTKIVALTLALAATASISANALPHFPMHRHPGASQTQDARVTVTLVNPNLVARAVKVDNVVYEIQARHVLSIKAPVGTKVYAGNNGRLHHKGDILFAVETRLQDKTLYLNEIN